MLYPRALLPSQLPTEIKSVVRDSFRDWPRATPHVRFDNVRGDDADRYVFLYSSDGRRGTAHAFKYCGSWLVTPVALSTEVISAAIAAMRSFYDDEIACHLRDAGSPEAQIREMRSEINVYSALLPHQGDSDPCGLLGEYEVVFLVVNPTGSDEAYFVGIDPEDTARVRADYFN